MDYADDSGYAKRQAARAKVGELYNQYRMEIIEYAPFKHPDSLKRTLVDYSNLTNDEVIIHGPYWSPNGNTALVQINSLKHKDRWIANLNLEDGKVQALIHDRDEARLGGPPIVGYYSIQLHD